MLVNKCQFKMTQLSCLASQRDVSMPYLGNGVILTDDKFNESWYSRALIQFVSYRILECHPNGNGK